MLYQSGTQRIEIVIRKDVVPTDNTTDVDKVTSQNGAGADENGGGDGVSDNEKLILTNVTHSLSTAKMLTDLGIEYQLGGFGYRTGDQAYQDAIQRKFEVVKDVTNVVSSTGLGALYGSKGGVIGAIVGASLGAIKSIGSTVVKYKGRDRDYTYKVFKEDNSIQYVRSRADINLTTGRLR